MPRATLIGEPWTTRTMVFGNKRFIFKGGEPRDVPVAVALVLKNNRDGKERVFKVDGLPTIVKAVHPPIEKVEESKTRIPRQRKLEEWPS